MLSFMFFMSLLILDLPQKEWEGICLSKEAAAAEALLVSRLLSTCQLQQHLCTPGAEAVALLPVILQKSSRKFFCFDSKQVTFVSAVYLQITSIKTRFMYTKLLYHLDENLE